MLSDIGCEYAIVGHSERRALFGETSTGCRSEIRCQAQKTGLRPILCVGETLEQREADETESVIDEQLNAVLDSSGADVFGQAIIAYEPVWAIGTGMKTASPEQAQDVHQHIRAALAARRSATAAESTKILYGGSVKGD